MNDPNYDDRSIEKKTAEGLCLENIIDDSNYYCINRDN